MGGMRGMNGMEGMKAMNWWSGLSGLKGMMGMGGMTDMQRIAEEWEKSREADIERLVSQAQTEAVRSTTEDTEMVRQFDVMAPSLVEEEWRRSGRKISDEEVRSATAGPLAYSPAADGRSHNPACHRPSTRQRRITFRNTWP